MYYNSWHQCKYDYSDEEPQCAKLKGWTMGMCPFEWVRWRPRARSLRRSAAQPPARGRAFSLSASRDTWTTQRRSMLACCCSSPLTTTFGKALLREAAPPFAPRKAHHTAQRRLRLFLMGCRLWRSLLTIRTSAPLTTSVLSSPLCSGGEVGGAARERDLPGPGAGGEEGGRPLGAAPSAAMRRNRRSLHTCRLGCRRAPATQSVSVCRTRKFGIASGRRGA